MAAVAEASVGLAVVCRAVAALPAVGDILFCMWKWLLALAVFVIVIFGSFWFLSGKDPVQTPEAAQATTTVKTPGTTTPNVIRDQPMTVTLHTSMGDISLQMFASLAPNTVANFTKLAGEGFYDNVKFHRVIKGFMDQAGDPLTKDDSMQARWGTGGPGYTIPDEFSTTVTNVAGTIAMANTGQPNSSGSQFFLNAVDNHFLDGKYTVFGKVISGMDVVTAINNVQTDANDRPLTPVIIKSVSVTQ